MVNPLDLDREALAKEARQRIASGIQELRESMASYDAFDVVANLTFSNEPFDAETYSQTEHQGLGAIIEMGALIVLERESRQGEGERPPFIQGPVVTGWNDRLREILHNTLILSWTELAEEDPEGLNGLRYAIRNYELFVRYHSYESQERRVLRELFPEELSDVCRDAVGFTVDEALSFIEQLSAIPRERLFERADEGKRHHEKLMDARERLRKKQNLRTLREPFAPSLAGEGVYLADRHLECDGTVAVEGQPQRFPLIHGDENPAVLAPRFRDAIRVVIDPSDWKLSKARWQRVGSTVVWDPQGALERQRHIADAELIVVGPDLELGHVFLLDCR